MDRPQYANSSSLGHSRSAHLRPAESETDWNRWKSLLMTMFVAREIDRVELDLVRQGRAFFHVAGGGHEATATLADCLDARDFLHLHYRDKALLLARGVAPREFFLSLLCKAESHSAGRQMSAHFSHPELNVLSMVGPVGNNALQAVGVAATLAERHAGRKSDDPLRADDQARPIVVCSVGDGTTQQGEFLEAVGQAVRDQLPVFFLIEDNRWAISTPTRGKTLFELPDGQPDSYLGMPIHRIDGRDPWNCSTQLASVVAEIRRTGRPAMAVLEVARLTDHTNADDQTLYRDAAEIEACRAQADPIARLEMRLIEEAGLSRDAISAMRSAATDEVRVAVEQALGAAEPVASMDAKASLSAEMLARGEYRGANSGRTVTMREALNGVLNERLAHDERVVLFGQDIEDPKGDVFGVTKGLSRRYPGRVLNSPLSESTIVGTAVGRALAGQRPVAFLQFADFLPLAYNQIVSELGSMYWRTNGGWQCPVIVMITCGGYRPGLGPFHAQSLESVAAHTPGVDVVMPATAADAAGLLNAAFESGRPTLFFYPKSCLNLGHEGTTNDVADQFVPLGKARRVRAGKELTIVSWGNPLQPAAKAAELLDEYGCSVDLLDLRSLSPWDEETVLESAERTGRLLVVHEDNRTCGFGAEVASTIAERTRRAIRIKRVARPDTFVPCNFPNQMQVLPSLERILDAAAELLDLEVSWDRPSVDSNDDACVAAIGSGPADDEVEVIEIKVRVGDEVAPGQIVAEVEATKSVVDVAATIGGRVAEILATRGSRLPVGAPLIRLHAPNRPRTAPSFTDSPGKARIRRSTTASSQEDPTISISAHLHVGEAVSVADDRVSLLDVVGVKPRRKVTNDELRQWLPQWTETDIVDRTGIESRYWASPDETVLTLAADAAGQLLARHSLSLSDLDLVIACTTTPDCVTPSLASRVCHALQQPGVRATVPGYDINAACSGFLFALRQAHDYLRTQPEGRVMIVTSEVLSPMLDRSDPATLPVFGDAAAAALVVGRALRDECPLHFHLPVLAGHPEDGRLLGVPLAGAGTIHMRGGEVFVEAVRSMTRILTQACARGGLGVPDLDLVIPHQANQRILDAVAHRVGRPAFSNIRTLGNTSSCTIPLALEELIPTVNASQRWGIAAFGGGFTFAAAVADFVPVAARAAKPCAA